MARGVNFTTVIILLFFSVFILFSCKSHEQKADVAFELVKEEKMMPKDSDSVITKITEPVDKKASSDDRNKQENIDEWSKFKIETERKILMNENKIKKIKGIPNVNIELLRKVTFLEKDNNDLRMQLDEYNEEVKMRWEKFKEKINEDANQIGSELNEMTINDKK